MTEKEKNNLCQQLERLEKSELIQILLHQAEQIEMLKAEVKRLGKALEQSLRTEKQQAAQFGRKDIKRSSSKPGRKKDHKGLYRQCSAPIAEQAVYFGEAGSCPLLVESLNWNPK